MPLGGGSQGRGLAPVLLLPWVCIKEQDDRIRHVLHFWNELLIYPLTPLPTSGTSAPTIPSTGSMRQNQKLQAAKQVE